MKSFQVRGLAVQAANAQEKVTAEVQTVPKPPQGNRKQRRANGAVNRRLNHQLQKLSSLGPVDVSVGPDGIPHVRVHKDATQKLLKAQAADIEALKVKATAFGSNVAREVRSILEASIARGRDVECIIDALANT